MSRRYAPAALLVLLGTAVLRITLFGELYLRYVQAGLKVWLVLSGAVLVGLGLVTGVLRWREGREGRGEDDGDGHAGHQAHAGHGKHAARAAHEEHTDHEDDADEGHAHSHSHGGRTVWLLALPAAALLLFPPPALGSYSASREATARAAQGVGTFPALAAGDPVQLTLAQFSSRAIYDSGRSLKGRTVRLTGFVTHGSDGTWYVTRLLVTCCAADATTSKIEVRGADAPTTDTWVTVTGVWHPKGALGSDAAWPPVMDSTNVVKVNQPTDPYEKP